MNIPVSKIKNRFVRRITILLTFPFLVALSVPLVLWNAVIDLIGWWVTLVCTGKREW